MKLLVSQALAIGLSQNGVREINHSNTGPQVDQYLKAAGEPTGEPWCAAFGVWCIKQACALLGLPYPCIVSGYCPDWFDWGRQHGILRTSPQAGDIGLVDEGNGYHHYFLVVAVGDGFVKTIEGNTNDNGSREGDGVYNRHRPFSTRYAYVRWSDLLPNDFYYSLSLNGQPVKDASGQPVLLPVIKGTAMVPARAWANALGFSLDWEDKSHTLILQGAKFPGALVLIDPATGQGSAYYAIRTLARNAGLQVDGDSMTRTINVHK